jgi:hypothetical protein
MAYDKLHYKGLNDYFLAMWLIFVNYDGFVRKKIAPHTKRRPAVGIRFR